MDVETIIAEVTRQVLASVNGDAPAVTGDNLVPFTKKDGSIIMVTPAKARAYANFVAQASKKGEKRAAPEGQDSQAKAEAKPRKTSKSNRKSKKEGKMDNSTVTVYENSSGLMAKRSRYAVAEVLGVDKPWELPRNLDEIKALLADKGVSVIVKPVAEAPTS